MSSSTGELVYEDDLVQLYRGDMREVLPSLGIRPDLIVADPPYGETPLEWDQWPDGWLEACAAVSSSMWCFGSFRMFHDHGDEFRAAGWKFSQDVVWEKQECSGFTTPDRFAKVHELAAHWYRGKWADIHHEAPVTLDGDKRRIIIKETRLRRAEHRGDIGQQRNYVRDNGERLARSVIMARNMHHHAIHPTEKSAGILDPLISFGCPEGGLVLDPFAGSGSTLETARMLGRRCTGIELGDGRAEAAAQRLAGVPPSAINAQARRGT